MIILIDAYNLLKTVLHVQFVSEKQRLDFFKLFEKYLLHRTNNKIILVFDGGHDLYQAEFVHKGIKIIYAGSLQIADDVLKKKIYELQSQDLLLITCDREIRRYAAQYQIESLGSVEFYKLLQNSIHQQESKEMIIAQTIFKTSNNDNIQYMSIRFSSNK